MYCVFYLYRVSARNADHFLRIAGEAAGLYRRFGAVDCVILRVTDGSAMYGCLGLTDLIKPNEDESVYIGIDSFADAEQFRLSMKRIDSDPKIGELFKEMQKIIDLSKVVRWVAEEWG